jgi:hypothetical protein
LFFELLIGQRHLTLHLSFAFHSMDSPTAAVDGKVRNACGSLALKRAAASLDEGVTLAVEVSSEAAAEHVDSSTTDLVQPPKRQKADAAAAPPQHVSFATDDNPETASAVQTATTAVPKSVSFADSKQQKHASLQQQPEHHQQHRERSHNRRQHTLDDADETAAAADAGAAAAAGNGSHRLEPNQLEGSYGKQQQGQQHGQHSALHDKAGSLANGQHHKHKRGNAQVR